MDSLKYLFLQLFFNWLAVKYSLSRGFGAREVVLSWWLSASILSRSISYSMLSVSASWYTWGSSCTATVSVTSRPVLSWVCSTLRLLLSSDERGWISSVSTSRPVLSVELSSSLKELTLISWERNVFLSSWTPITSCVTPGRPDLSRIGFGIGWVGWKLLDSCSTFGRWACSEPNSCVQSCRNEIFGGGRRDMYVFSYQTSPVFSLTTFIIQKALCFWASLLNGSHRSNSNKSPGSIGHWRRQTDRQVFS